MVTLTDLHYDPYDREIEENPYPTFRRLREEAPLYHNEEHGFYALSRYADVEQALCDHQTFSSARGNVLELIKMNIELPSGVFIMEDPPLHTVHRSLLSRVFTAKKMLALESEIRAYCVQLLDPLVGSGHFDFVQDLGARLPMQVIGKMLGIPEQDQQAIRAQGEQTIGREPGAPAEFAEDQFADARFFEDYIEWRVSHPSDDLMTELLNAEFEDEKGVLRTLTRDELLIFVNVLSTAGNETTNRLIGWAGSTLANHPDQLRELAEDQSLIPGAIEEILRFEAPALHGCRTLTKDVELYGQTVPKDSIIMLLWSSANRDDRAYPPNGDVFDIHRGARHLTFGKGIHFCLGAALAKLEGRVALEEILTRFPTWEVDWDNAHLDSSIARGWKTLPTLIP